MSRATIEDTTLSIYYYVNKFITELNQIEGIPRFTFASTTSIEAADSMLQDTTNKIILVQLETETKIFTKIEYQLLVSLADTSDTNSIITGTVLNEFMQSYPRYRGLCIYEASGLKKPASELNDTLIKMVVTETKQVVVSRPQMRHNLNVVQFTVQGLINSEVGFDTYLVDDQGNYLVDDEGNKLIV